MKNNKLELNNDDKVWKGFSFWEEEIKKAGVFKELKFFSDVVTEKKPPHPESGYREPVLINVMLGGKKCDIYHTDHDRGDSWSRIFIHIKE